MPSAQRTSGRRSNALTRQQIITAAIDLLDAGGAGALTFRALSLQLKTGHGAIQWHISSKGELLAAATAAIVDTLPQPESGASARESVRTLAIGLFDAIEKHPWVGRHLANEAWNTTIQRLFERLGQQVQALGVAPAAHFIAASALLNHIVGASARNAANTLLPQARIDRQDLLDQTAQDWDDLDPDEYPFTRSVAGQLRTHDDRSEYLAEIDLILDGMIPA
jgi:AcrR family transcriptional regulator